jgi:hypothetical protein
MTTPIISNPATVNYCIQGWAIDQELEFHSPCSGLYGDGFGIADGRYLGEGDAVIYPIFTAE